MQVLQKQFILLCFMLCAVGETHRHQHVAH